MTVTTDTAAFPNTAPRIKLAGLLGTVETTSRACANTARRCADILIRGRDFPVEGGAASDHMDDFLADFDRLSKLAEEVRQVRASLGMKDAA